MAASGQQASTAVASLGRKGLMMYRSVELNTVHVAVVVHSQVIEVNTCGDCTSSTYNLHYSRTVTYLPLVLGTLTISLPV